MAGLYGWNIDSIKDLLASESEFISSSQPVQIQVDDDENDNNDKEDKNDDDDDDSDNENDDGDGDVDVDDGDDDDDEDEDEEKNSDTSSSENSKSIQPSIKGYYWCVTNGEIPSQAVRSGIDKDGGDIYVGRAFHEGELLPAKIVPNHGCAYIAYDGEEISKDDYEFLCRGTCTIMWQECRDGAVPDNAVTGGCTADNEKLYIGRVFYNGTQTPGKVQPSQNACFIPFAGEELSFTTYEVLVLQ